MDASKALISQIFSRGRLLEIPFYQRTYVWGEEQWSRLLDDMEFVTKTKRNYFMGPVILKQDTVPSTCVYSDKRIIIDGQQRMTTIMIFLKVLLLLEDNNKLFDRNYRLDDDSIQMVHGHNDIVAFKKVVDHEEKTEIENPDPASQIIAAYNYFLKNIPSRSIDRTAVQQYVQFVCIDLGKEEDEQQVFDTINSLGVRLTTAELLKNYFFNRDNLDEYKKNWVEIFEKDDDAKIYWDTEIEAGRIKKSMIDIFFDAYFQMFLQNKKYSISTEDKIAYNRLDRLAKSYQDFINNYCNGDKSVVISDMATYANAFYKVFRPEACDTTMPATMGIDRINVIIFGLKTTTIIPYVLYVATNVSDQNELKEIYRVLETYIMRRIVTHASTKNYNNLFLSLIANEVLTADRLYEELENQEATTYMPDNDDLRNGFHNSYLVNLQTRGILYFIESAIRPANSATALLGFNNYSLEHMMPKKWRNNWGESPDKDNPRARDNKLLTLGNLAIIPQTLNSAIRDSNWETKKNGKGDSKPGLCKCAAGICTMNDALQKSEWNEAGIESRAEWLYEQARDLWKTK